MRALRANAVWLALIGAGLGLGALVLSAWPEPTVKVVRLPYGEAVPKTPAPERAPASAAQRPRRVTPPAPAWEPAPLAPEEEAEEDADRVLAGVEPEATGPRPAPVQSPVDLDDGYEQESPEQLGAEPLPGAVLTPPQPPAAG